MLLNNKREDDVLGRWGGEEFIILLRNTTKTQALEITEKLRAKIEKTVFKIEDKNIKLTASFGVSQWQGSKSDFKTLFTQADRALYKAKNSGRNKVM